MWRTYGAPIHASPPVKEEARDPNEKMGEWFDSEALGWAASFGELDAVRELIICGANPLRPANKAGETPKSDAQRERHTHVVNFLTAYAKVVKGKAPMTQTMSGDDGRPSEYDPDKVEDNWGFVLCPIAGHPEFDKGAYHHPLGLCCYTTRRYEEKGADEIVGNVIFFPITIALYAATLCYQPCGCLCAKQVPWMGDCPCTVHRVTRKYVLSSPNCLTRGPAKDRIDAGITT